MFEKYVSGILVDVLSEFAEDVDPKQLNLRIMTGEASLRNLKLKPSLLAKMGLPFVMTKGICGKVDIRIPITSLQSVPCVVTISDFFVTLQTPMGASVDPKFLQQQELRVKMQIVEAFEEERKRLAAEKGINTREAMEHAKELEGGGSGGGFVSNLAEVIINNAEVNITNVHIRYESPMHGSIGGAFFSSLSLLTVDKNNKPTFVSPSDTYCINKRLAFTGLQVYADDAGDDYHSQTRNTQPSSAQQSSLFVASIQSDADWMAAMRNRVAAGNVKGSTLVGPMDGETHATVIFKRAINNHPDQPYISLLAEVQRFVANISKPQLQTLASIAAQLSNWQSLSGLYRFRPTGSPRDILRGSSSSTTAFSSRPPNLEARRWWYFASRSMLQLCKETRREKIANNLSAHFRPQYEQLYAKQVLSDVIKTSGLDVSHFEEKSAVASWKSKVMTPRDKTLLQHIINAMTADDMVDARRAAYRQVADDVNTLKQHLAKVKAERAEKKKKAFFSFAVTKTEEERQQEAMLKEMEAEWGIVAEAAPAPGSNGAAGEGSAEKATTITAVAAALGARLPKTYRWAQLEVHLPEGSATLNLSPTQSVEMGLVSVRAKAAVFNTPSFGTIAGSLSVGDIFLSNPSPTTSKSIPHLITRHIPSSGGKGAAVAPGVPQPPLIAISGVLAPFEGIPTACIEIPGQPPIGNSNQPVDLRYSVSVLPLLIIADPSFLLKLRNFCTLPDSVNLDGLSARARSILDDASNAVSLQAAQVYRTSRAIDARTDIAAPIIVIPENLHSPSRPAVVISLGRLLYQTNPITDTEKSRRIAQLSDVKGNAEIRDILAGSSNNISSTSDISKSVLDLLFYESKGNLTGFRVGCCSLTSALRNPKDGLDILPDHEVSFSVFMRLSGDHTTLPSIAVNVRVSKMKLQLSVHTTKLVCDMLKHWSKMFAVAVSDNIENPLAAGLPGTLKSKLLISGGGEGVGESTLSEFGASTLLKALTNKDASQFEQQQSKAVKNAAGGDAVSSADWKPHPKAPFLHFSISADAFGVDIFDDVGVRMLLLKQQLQQCNEEEDGRTTRTSAVPSEDLLVVPTTYQICPVPRYVLEGTPFKITTAISSVFEINANVVLSSLSGYRQQIDVDQMIPTILGGTLDQSPLDAFAALGGGGSGNVASTIAGIDVVMGRLRDSKATGKRYFCTGGSSCRIVLNVPESPPSAFAGTRIPMSLSLGIVDARPQFHFNTDAMRLLESVMDCTNLVLSVMEMEEVLFDLSTTATIPNASVLSSSSFETVRSGSSVSKAPPSPARTNTTTHHDPSLLNLDAGGKREVDALRRARRKLSSNPTNKPSSTTTPPPTSSRRRPTPLLSTATSMVFTLRVDGVELYTYSNPAFATLSGGARLGGDQLQREDRIMFSRAEEDFPLLIAIIEGIDCTIEMSELCKDVDVAIQTISVDSSDTTLQERYRCILAPLPPGDAAKLGLVNTTSSSTSSTSSQPPMIKAWVKMTSYSQDAILRRRKQMELETAEMQRRGASGFIDAMEVSRRGRGPTPVSANSNNASPDDFDDGDQVEVSLSLSPSRLVFDASTTMALVDWATQGFFSQLADAMTRAPYTGTCAFDVNKPFVVAAALASLEVTSLGKPFVANVIDANSLSRLLGGWVRRSEAAAVVAKVAQQQITLTSNAAPMRLLIDLDIAQPYVLVPHAPRGTTAAESGFVYASFDALRVKGALLLDPLSQPVEYLSVSISGTTLRACSTNDDQEIMKPFGLNIEITADQKYMDALTAAFVTEMHHQEDNSALSMPPPSNDDTSVLKSHMPPVVAPLHLDIIVAGDAGINLSLDKEATSLVIAIMARNVMQMDPVTRWVELQDEQRSRWEHVGAVHKKEINKIRKAVKVAATEAIAAVVPAQATPASNTATAAPPAVVDDKTAADDVDPSISLNLSLSNIAVRFAQSRFSDSPLFSLAATKLSVTIEGSSLLIGWESAQLVDTRPTASSLTALNDEVRKLVICGASKVEIINSVVPLTEDDQVHYALEQIRREHRSRSRLLEEGSQSNMSDADDTMSSPEAKKIAGASDGTVSAYLPNTVKNLPEVVSAQQRSPSTTSAAPSYLKSSEVHSLATYAGVIGITDTTSALSAYTSATSAARSKLADIVQKGLMPTCKPVVSINIAIEVQRFAISNQWLVVNDMILSGDNLATIQSLVDPPSSPSSQSVTSTPPVSSSSTAENVNQRKTDDEAIEVTSESWSELSLSLNVPAVALYWMNAVGQEVFRGVVSDIGVKVAANSAPGPSKRTDIVSVYTHVGTVDFTHVSTCHALLHNGDVSSTTTATSTKWLQASIVLLSSSTFVQISLDGLRADVSMPILHELIYLATDEGEVLSQLAGLAAVKEGGERVREAAIEEALKGSTHVQFGWSRPRVFLWCDAQEHLATINDHYLGTSIPTYSQDPSIKSTALRIFDSRQKVATSSSPLKSANKGGVAPKSRFSGRKLQLGVHNLNTVISLRNTRVYDVSLRKKDAVLDPDYATLISQPLKDLPQIDVNKSLITATVRLDRVSIPGMLSTGLIEGDCNASVFAPRTALISKPSPTNHVGTISEYVRSHRNLLPTSKSSPRLLYLAGLHVEGAVHVGPISILVNSEVLAATTALIYNNILLPPPLVTALALRTPSSTVSTTTPTATTTKADSAANMTPPPPKSVADILVAYGDLLPPTFQLSLIAEEASVIIQRPAGHHSHTPQQSDAAPPKREASIMFDESLDASKYCISQEGTLIANDNEDYLDDSRRSVAASSTITIQKELSTGFVNVAAITASMFQAFAGGAKEGTQDSLTASLRGLSAVEHLFELPMLRTGELSTPITLSKSPTSAGIHNFLELRASRRPDSHHVGGVAAEVRTEVDLSSIHLLLVPKTIGMLLDLALSPMSLESPPCAAEFAAIEKTLRRASSSHIKVANSDVDIGSDKVKVENTTPVQDEIDASGIPVKRTFTIRPAETRIDLLRASSSSTSSRDTLDESDVVVTLWLDGVKVDLDSAFWVPQSKFIQLFGYSDNSNGNNTQLQVDDVLSDRMRTEKLAIEVENIILVDRSRTKDGGGHQPVSIVRRAQSTSATTTSSDTAPNSLLSIALYSVPPPALAPPAASPKTRISQPADPNYHFSTSIDVELDSIRLLVVPCCVVDIVASVAELSKEVKSTKAARERILEEAEKKLNTVSNSLTKFDIRLQEPHVVLLSNLANLRSSNPNVPTGDVRGIDVDISGQAAMEVSPGTLRVTSSLARCAGDLSSSAGGEGRAAVLSYAVALSGVEVSALGAVVITHRDAIAVKYVSRQPILERIPTAPSRLRTKGGASSSYKDDFFEQDFQAEVPHVVMRLDKEQLYFALAWTGGLLQDMAAVLNQLSAQKDETTKDDAPLLAHRGDDSISTPTSPNATSSRFDQSKYEANATTNVDEATTPVVTSQRLSVKVSSVEMHLLESLHLYIGEVTASRETTLSRPEEGSPDQYISSAHVSSICALYRLWPHLSNAEKTALLLSQQHHPSSLPSSATTNINNITAMGTTSITELAFNDKEGRPEPFSVLALIHSVTLSREEDAVLSNGSVDSTSASVGLAKVGLLPCAVKDVLTSVYVPVMELLMRQPTYVLPRAVLESQPHVAAAELFSSSSTTSSTAAVSPTVKNSYFKRRYGDMVAALMASPPYTAPASIAKDSINSSSNRPAEYHLTYMAPLVVSSRMHCSFVLDLQGGSLIMDGPSPAAHILVGDNVHLTIRNGTVVLPGIYSFSSFIQYGSNSKVYIDRDTCTIIQKLFVPPMVAASRKAAASRSSTSAVVMDSRQWTADETEEDGNAGSSVSMIAFHFNVEASLETLPRALSAFSEGYTKLARLPASTDAQKKRSLESSSSPSTSRPPLLAILEDMSSGGGALVGLQTTNVVHGMKVEGTIQLALQFDLIAPSSGASQSSTTPPTLGEMTSRSIDVKLTRLCSVDERLLHPTSLCINLSGIHTVAISASLDKIESNVKIADLGIILQSAQELQNGIANSLADPTGDDVKAQKSADIDPGMKAVEWTMLNEQTLQEFSRYVHIGKDRSTTTNSRRCCHCRRYPSKEVSLAGGGPVFYNLMPPITDSYHCDDMTSTSLETNNDASNARSLTKEILCDSKALEEAERQMGFLCAECAFGSEDADMRLGADIRITRIDVIVVGKTGEMVEVMLKDTVVNKMVLSPTADINNMMNANNNKKKNDPKTKPDPQSDFYVETAVHAWVFNTRFAVWEPLLDDGTLLFEGSIPNNIWNAGLGRSAKDRAVITVSPFAIRVLAKIGENLAAQFESSSPTPTTDTAVKDDQASLPKASCAPLIAVKTLNYTAVPITLSTTFDSTSESNADVQTDWIVLPGDTLTSPISSSMLVLTRDEGSDNAETITMNLSSHTFLTSPSMVCEVIPSPTLIPVSGSSDNEGPETIVIATVIVFPIHCKSGSILRVLNSVPIPVKVDGITKPICPGENAYFPAEWPLLNPFSLTPLECPEGKFNHAETESRHGVCSLRTILNGAPVLMSASSVADPTKMVYFRISASSSDSLCGAPRFTIKIEGGCFVTNHLPATIAVDLYRHGASNTNNQTAALRPVQEGIVLASGASAQIIIAPSLNGVLMSMQTFQKQGNSAVSDASDTFSTDVGSGSGGGPKALYKGTHPLTLQRVGRSVSSSSATQSMTILYTVDPHRISALLHSSFQLLNHSAYSLDLSEGSSSDGAQNWSTLPPRMTNPFSAMACHNLSHADYEKDKKPSLLVTVKCTHNGKRYASESPVPFHAVGATGQITLVVEGVKHPTASSATSGLSTRDTIQLCYSAGVSLQGDVGGIIVTIVPRWTVVNKTGKEIALFQQFALPMSGVPSTMRTLFRTVTVPAHGCSHLAEVIDPSVLGNKSTEYAAAASFLMRFSSSRNPVDILQVSNVAIPIEEVNDAHVCLPPRATSAYSPAQYSTLRLSASSRSTINANTLATSMAAAKNELAHIANNANNSIPSGNSETLLDEVDTQLRVCVAKNGPRMMVVIDESEGAGFVVANRSSHQFVLSTPSTHFEGLPKAQARGSASGKQNSIRNVVPMEGVVKGVYGRALAVVRPLDMTQFCFDLSNGSNMIPVLEVTQVSGDLGSQLSQKSSEKMWSVDIQSSSIGLTYHIPLQAADGGPPLSSTVYELDEHTLCRVFLGRGGQTVVEMLPAKRSSPYTPIVVPRYSSTTSAFQNAIPSSSSQKSDAQVIDLRKRLISQCGASPLDMTLYVRYLSISVVSQPIELVNLAIEDARLHVNRTSYSERITFTLKRYQIDNQSEDSPPYKCAVFPVKRDRNALEASILRAVVPGRNLIDITDISANCAPFVVKIGDVLLVRAMKFGEALAEEFASGSHGNTVATASDDAKQRLERESRSSDNNSMPPPTMQELYNDAPSTTGIGATVVIIERMSINPVVVRLWFARQMDEQNLDIVRTKIDNPIISYCVQSIEDVTLEIPGMAYQSQCALAQTLLSKYKTHYIDGITKQAAAIVFQYVAQLPLIGAPIKLISDAGMGLAHFFKDPIDGITDSPEAFALGVAKGSVHLVGGAVGGVFSAVGNVTGSAAKIASIAAGDKVNHNQKKANTLTGFYRGFTGIVTKPMQGAAEGGVLGGMKGFGHGLLGVATQPVAGILNDITKASSATGSVLRDKHISECHRERNLRVFFPGGAVAPLGAVIETFEHQRRYAGNVHFSSRLLPMDGDTWKPASREKVAHKNNCKQTVLDDWVVDRSAGVTFDGWSYGRRIEGPFGETKGHDAHVRRRRWAVVLYSRTHDSNIAAQVDGYNQKSLDCFAENDDDATSFVGDSTSSSASSTSPSMNATRGPVNPPSGNAPTPSQAGASTAISSAAAAGSAYVSQEEDRSSATVVTVEVYENERKLPFGSYSASKLLPTDRSQWSSRDGHKMVPRNEVGLQGIEWSWDGPWRFVGGDAEGWEYALDFPRTYHPKKGLGDFVRRRCWRRVMKKSPHSGEDRM